MATRKANASSNLFFWEVALPILGLIAASALVMGVTVWLM